jgi:predicted secreted protein
MNAGYVMAQMTKAKKSQDICERSDAFCEKEEEESGSDGFRHQMQELIDFDSTADERTHIQVEGEFVEVTESQASEIRRRAWYGFSTLPICSTECVSLSMTKCRSSKLFRAYDKNYSGTLDAQEFLVILQVLDPTLEMEDVMDTFQSVGAVESLDQELFSTWCQRLLADFSDQEFRERIQELVDVSNSVGRPFALTAGSLQFLGLDSTAFDVDDLSEMNDLSEDPDALKRGW